MAFTNIGSISAQVAIPTVIHPAGILNVGPVGFADKYSFGMVLVDWTQITDLLADVSLSVDFSLDGVTFNTVGGFSLDLPRSGCAIGAGGVGLVDQFGIPFRTTSFNLRIPQGTLTTRQIRGSLTLSVPGTVGATVVFW